MTQQLVLGARIVQLLHSARCHSSPTSYDVELSERLSVCTCINYKMILCTCLSASVFPYSELSHTLSLSVYFSLSRPVSSARQATVDPMTPRVVADKQRSILWHLRYNIEEERSGFKVGNKGTVRWGRISCQTLYYYRVLVRYGWLERIFSLLYRL